MENLQFLKPVFKTLRQGITQAFGNPQKITNVKPSDGILFSILVVLIIMHYRQPQPVIVQERNDDAYYQNERARARAK